MEMDQVCNGSPAPQGYLPVPTADPPPAYSASTGSSFVAQPQCYQPLSSSQQNSSNVVVVNQPRNYQITQQVSRPNDYLVVTIILFIFCLLCGNVTVMFCLLPAVIFSIIANTYNDGGEYNLAKKFGSVACTCNIVVVLFSATIVLIGAIVAIVLLFVTGILNL